MKNHSKQDLDLFLDFLGQKGLVPKSTISARKASANKVLSVLDEDELSDIFALDIDEVAERFANLEGKNYTPDSLRSYVSRAKVAIEDFQRYVESPMTFKAKNSGAVVKQKPSKSGMKVIKAHSPSRPPESSSSKQSASFGNAVLPIPIREDLIVQVHGIPFDLSEAEANKIANVIRAMAM